MANTSKAKDKVENPEAHFAKPKEVVKDNVLRGGPGCLNRISASISGASAKVRLPSGVAAG